MYLISSLYNSAKSIIIIIIIICYLQLGSHPVAAVCYTYYM